MGRLGRTLRAIGLTAIVVTVSVLGLGTWLADTYPAEDSVANGAQPAAQRMLKSATYRDASEPTLPRRAAPVLPGAVPTGEALIVPVAGLRPAQLVDTFTQARAGGQRSHDAIDIAAPLGTPVIAAATGRLARLFHSRDGGNTAYIRSLDGRLIYYYAHLDRYAPGLVEGKVIRRGDPIGTVGYSGNANPSAPHLHFAVSVTQPQAKESAQPINPYPLLIRARR